MRCSVLTPSHRPLGEVEVGNSWNLSMGCLGILPFCRGGFHSLMADLGSLHVRVRWPRSPPVHCYTQCEVPGIRGVKGVRTRPRGSFLAIWRPWLDPKERKGVCIPREGQRGREEGGLSGEWTVLPEESGLLWGSPAVSFWTQGSVTALTVHLTSRSILYLLIQIKFQIVIFNLSFLFGNFVDSRAAVKK